MSLVLGKDEQVVKDWQYATTTGKNDAINHDLTITNKRVVIHEEAEKYVHYDEIAIENVKRVETKFHKKRSPSGVIVALMGLFLLIMGIIGFITKVVALGVVMLLMGLFMIVVGIIAFIRIVKANIIVSIYCAPMVYGLGLGASNISRMFKKSGSSATILIKVNAEVAKEITETLGSLILVK